MENDIVESELKKIESKLHSLRFKAQGYKTTTLIFVALCLSCVLIFEVIPKMLVKDYPVYAIILMVALFYAAILLPMAYTPLNKFLSDNTHYSINHSLKRTFVLHNLNKFTCSLEFKPHNGFDEEFLIRNNIIKKGIKGGTSDDFLIGYFNHHKVKLAEYHVGGLFKSDFDGYLAVIDATNLEPFSYYSTEFKHQRTSHNVPQFLETLFRNRKNLAFVVNIEDPFSIEKTKSSTIILGMQGNKKMLEYNFAKVKENLYFYRNDLEIFHQTLSLIDELTKISSPIKLPHTFQ